MEYIANYCNYKSLTTMETFYWLSTSPIDDEALTLVTERSKMSRDLPKREKESDDITFLK